MPPDVWTIARLLAWTADYLKRHGSDSPRLDAEVLLAHALDCQRIQLYTRFDQQPPEARRTVFRDLVRRRAEGQPVAYLVGRREFYSLSFRVGPDVLIPRPDTEHLVIAALDLAKQVPGPRDVTICDVGTGSGIIAIAIAKHLPRARVTALDISPAALDVARQNAADHGVSPRIEFLSSDLLSALPPEAQFDLVVSNPPYVSASEYEALDRGVRDFEPRQALLAGPNGTEVIARLAAQAQQHLPPGGRLLLEISPQIHDAVQALLAAQSCWELEPTIKDLARLPRVVQARRHC